MWNSGATPSTTSSPRQTDPVTVGLGVEHHVAVRGHRALGRAGGARGVGQERDVVRVQRHRGRGLPAEALEQLGHVDRALASDALDAGEDPLVVAGLVLQLRRGEHRAHVGARHDLRRYVAVEALQAHQHGRPGVLQELAELALPVHRVDRHGDAAGLPRADLGDHELRHVLQVDRHPLTRREPGVDDAGRERVGQIVELAQGDPTVEVPDDVAVGIARHGRGEHVQRAVELHGSISAGCPGL